MSTARLFLASIFSGCALAAAAILAPLGAASAQAASLPLQGEAAAFVDSTFFWNFNAPPPAQTSPAARPRRTPIRSS
jgi:hypothetical protein